MSFFIFSTDLIGTGLFFSGSGMMSSVFRGESYHPPAGAVNEIGEWR